MITVATIRGQVEAAVFANGEGLAEGIDTDATTEEIHQRYGLVDVERIDHAEFWAMVQRHDSTQR